MTRSVSKRTPTCDGVVDLIEWNRMLACDRWRSEKLRMVISGNPVEIVLRTGDRSVTIRANEFYQHRELLKLPGIDPKRVKELYGVGLLAASACQTYFYEGRRIIALFCGNLKALDRLEKLLRTGKS